MLPFRDHNPSRRFPAFTVGLIAINVLVFLYQLSLNASGQLDAFIFQWAVVPADIVLRPNGQELLTLFTAMFMHGSIAHIGGNMLYLWIFGDNIEDTLGGPLYVGFYLLCGLMATAAQIITDPASPIPNLGASGAIAGVLGAYLLLFPHARVDTLIGYWVVEVPALIVLGFWFVLQLINGVGSLGVPMDGGGVAFWAHAGGFAAGFLLMLLIRPFVNVRRYDD